jgi:hypothetical protein
MNEVERNLLRNAEAYHAGVKEGKDSFSGMLKKEKEAQKKMEMDLIRGRAFCGGAGEKEETESKMNMTPEQALDYDKKMQNRLLLDKITAEVVRLGYINAEMYKLALLRDDFSGKMLEDLRALHYSICSDIKKDIEDTGLTNVL